MIEKPQYLKHWQTSGVVDANFEIIDEVAGDDDEVQWDYRPSDWAPDDGQLSNIIRDPNWVHHCTSPSPNPPPHVRLHFTFTPKSFTSSELALLAEKISQQLHQPKSSSRLVYHLILDSL